MEVYWAVWGGVLWRCTGLSGGGGGLRRPIGRSVERERRRDVLVSGLIFAVSHNSL